MKKLNNSVLNILLAAGVILILVGLFFVFQIFAEIDEHLPVSSVLTSIVGAVLVYISLALKRNAFFFFMGVYVFLLGVMSFFVTMKAFPEFQIYQFWPVSMIVCFVCLFLTCIYKYKKLKVVYAFPASLIGGLGILFLLFSLDVIKISFVDFISRWWPLMLIACGGVLVFIFLYQQTPDNHFPYDKDESDFMDGNKIEE